jgi:hypothetical protein
MCERAKKQERKSTTSMKDFSLRKQPRARAIIAVALTSLIILSAIKICKKETKLLLITGCPRSGTTYTAKCLKESGMDINHEFPGAQGCVSFSMVDNYYHELLPAFNVEFKHVFHQVRDPLDVISSIYTNYSAQTLWCKVYSYLFRRFTSRSIPEYNNNDSSLIMIAKFYYYWNLKAEKMAEWRYRIEDFVSIIPEFERRLGIQVKIGNVPKNTNTWHKINRKFTWKDLEEQLPSELCLNLKNMAQRYGYPDKD